MFSCGQVSEEEIEAEMDRMAPSRRQGRGLKSATDILEQPEDPVLEVLRGEQDPVLEVSGRQSAACSCACAVLTEMLQLEQEQQESLAEMVAALVAGAGELERVDSEVDMSELRAEGATSWEREQRAARLVAAVWQQQQLVEDMDRAVDAVDAAVEQLAARRLLVQRDAALLRHHLLVLHQELVIVKACEDREEALATKVADKEMARREVLNDINTIQNKLDAKARDVIKCQEKEKETELAFLEAVGENPFVDYLKKIFKKKYRPPRATDGE